MKQGIFTIVDNEALTPTTYRMELEGDVSAIEAPGQFLDIQIEGRYLRRPISICDVEYTDRYGREGIVTIIYKVLGNGTEEMSSFETGNELDILTGLGNGYDLKCSGDKPLLIGGGVGIPPLFMAAKRLIEQGKAVTVILGFNSADEMYYTNEFEAIGCRVITATADGSAGIKGFVTDAFKEACSGEEFTHFYSCGPEPMLRAVYDEVYSKAGISGQMSFEERMGCGFGACMGCSIKVKDGYKRICKDGPVLRTEEIVWQ